MGANYYPFGLMMAGISDKAIKSNYAENKYRFNNGAELQNKEFNDGSGLDMYQMDYRGYDPQIGRYWQIDPDADENENLSPYLFANDNPILLNDPLGADTTCPGCMPEVVVTPGPAPKRSTVNVGLADAGEDDVSVTAGPAPGSSSVSAGPTSNASTAANNQKAGIAVPAPIGIVGVGVSGIGLIVTGTVAVVGVTAWAAYDMAHHPHPTPTARLTGDIAIGVPKPYIPADLVRRLHPGTSIPPPCPYPQNPALPPVPGWQWRGKPGSIPGSRDGSWVNPNNKKEYLRPDVDHPDPIGPHWDWRSPDGQEYRYYPDGRLEPK